MNTVEVFNSLKEDLLKKGYVRIKSKKSKDNKFIYYIGIKNYSEIWNFINSISEYKEYVEIFEIKDLSELLVLFRDNLTEPPRCSHCGKKRKFEKRPPLRYIKTCGSNECYQKEIEATNLKKYGAKYVMQVPEIKERLYQNNLKKTGYAHALQNPEIYNKMLQKNEEKWGTKFPAQSEEVKQKAKNTNQERYGVDFYSQTDECKEKIINHNREVWGADYPQQSKKYRDWYDNSETAKKSFEKRSQTIKERYGVDNVTQVLEFKKKGWQKYKYNDLLFDSSWELIYYIYQTDHGIKLEREPIGLDYYDGEGKLHKYFPDFRLEDGTLVEVKGDHFFDENGNLISIWKDDESNLLKYKQQCMIDNNILLIKKEDLREMKNYVNRTYGRNFIKNCKNFEKENQIGK